MEISDLQAIGIGAPATSASEETAQDTFLTLMLAQLQNQDPMQPMENGEFLSQLAAFETAAGIGELEAAFAQLNEAIYGSQSLQAAALIDRSVIVEGDVAYLPEDGEMVAAVQLPASATEVFVEIHDASGQLVHTMAMPGDAAGEMMFGWDGVLEDGTRAAAGNYTISARAEMGGELAEVSTQIASEVKSVLFDDTSGIVVTLANGMHVPFDQVRQIT